jgi:ADP-ribosylation factor-like protein 8
MWERYCRGVNAIIFVVNRYDWDALPTAREELHLLMENESLRGIPLLVLRTEGNGDDGDYYAPAGSL